MVLFALSRLFQADLVARRLRYGDLIYVSRREIPIALPGDVHLRRKSFDNAVALLVALRALTPAKH